MAKKIGWMARNRIVIEFSAASPDAPLPVSPPITPQSNHLVLAAQLPITTNYRYLDVFVKYRQLKGHVKFLSFPL